MCDSLRSGASRGGGSPSCHSGRREESLNISRLGKRGQSCFASLNMTDEKARQVDSAEAASLLARMVPTEIVKGWEAI
jgi:hypothetical protein